MRGANPFQAVEVRFENRTSSIPENRIVHSQPQVDRQQEKRQQRNVFWVDESMSPEDRLGHEQQRRAKGSVPAHPARGKLVERPHPKQEHQEINEMLHIHGLESGNNSRQRFRDEARDHQKSRTIVFEAVACDRNRAVLEPRAVRFERVVGVAIEFHFIPGLTVLVEREDGNDEAKKKQDDERTVLFHVSFCKTRCHLALYIILTICPFPITLFFDEPGFDWIIEHIFDDTLQFVFIADNTIVTFILPKWA